MTNRDGTPIWYELITDNPDAAQAFYGPVMKWAFAPQPGAPGQDYRVFTAEDGEGVGGVMKSPDASIAPLWAVYFGVADVDKMAKKVTSLGGSIHMDPQDIPGVGRFAFVSDPQGACFYLMRGDSDIDSTAYAPSKPGHCTWNELVTHDQTAALEFYAALFGWEKSGDMPMGNNGNYTFIRSGEVEIGAMMDMPSSDKKPYWNFAFQVSDLDAVKNRAEKVGGTLTHGPIKLPTDDDWLIQVDDTCGAKVMFTGPRK